MSPILTFSIGVFVVAFIARRIIKGKYVAPHYTFIIENGNDKTGEMLMKLREVTQNYHTMIDVFEPNLGLLFTNVGIVCGDGSFYVPWEKVESITEPIVSTKKKCWRTFKIKVDGKEYDIEYYNGEKNQFKRMIKNFNEKKYPLPDYEGYRGSL